MEAMGGPCSGHLLVSHVLLMGESPVGQLNSLPFLSQTGATSPEQDTIFCGLRKKRGISHSLYLGVKESNLECDFKKNSPSHPYKKTRFLTPVQDVHWTLSNQNLIMIIIIV